MTPKDKAKELVESFYRSMFDIKLSDTHIMQTAKQCALICVGEILSWNPTLFWQEVRTEIENL
jgi:hypothetical protein